ncbi:hypothetical protein GCM10028805_33070 [Spirosoma harenae]
MGSTALTADGSGHLLTIAPTGSGKGRSVIIPNLLHYEGPTITLDIKGEAVQIARKRRLEMGHEVVILDPFCLVDLPRAGFNPFDVFNLPNADAQTDCQMMANILAGKRFSTDPYWDIQATNLLAGSILCQVLFGKDEEKNLNAVREMICGDIAYNLAVKMDSIGKKMPATLYQSISSYLNIPGDKTRPCVDSTAVSYLTSTLSAPVAAMLAQSTFSLADVSAGKPIDIFIVFPPDKLKSHMNLLVLIVATLLKAITSRQVIPTNKTLFLLDETAALGHFEYLETMMSLARGYGAIIHTFWQDLSQIKRFYGDGYLTILNNCAVWQLFGIQHHTIAREVADITGISLYELRQLKSNEQILIINGVEYKRARKLDYLHDAQFANQFDENPFFRLQPLMA